MTTKPDSPFPDSIREYLDAGQDVTELPEFDELVEMVVFAEAAGLAGQQRQVAMALYEELGEKGADALPSDLIGDDIDLECQAAEWRDHYRRVLDLLGDTDLRQRFTRAVPPARVALELEEAAAYRRRDEALQVVELFVADNDASTVDLEAVAGLIKVLIGCSGGVDRD